MLSFPVLPEPPKPSPPRQKPAPPQPPAHHLVHHMKPEPAKVVAQAPKPAVIPQSAPLEKAADTVPPAPPAASAPPAPSADPAPDIPATFTDKVRAAVQAAARYPFAARMAHVSGRVQVSFTYMDSVVSDLKVIVSSGHGALDDAARGAVESAAYPPPPPPFAGKALHFMVWVRFDQTAAASEQ